MASWDVDELESQLFFREEDKDGIEAEIRKIAGNRNIELHESDRKDGLVSGRLEAEGERWPCGDVGPMDMQGLGLAESSARGTASSTPMSWRTGDEPGFRTDPGREEAGGESPRPL